MKGEEKIPSGERGVSRKGFLGAEAGEPAKSGPFANGRFVALPAPIDASTISAYAKRANEEGDERRTGRETGKYMGIQNPRTQNPSMHSAT